MTLKNVVFASSLGALLAVAWPGLRARRGEPARAAALDGDGGLTVHAAWLAQRESAMGDWQSVAPPLRSGDELQLVVRADEEAYVYVLAESEGARRVLFPPADAAPSLARARAGWQYSLPARHLTWRLDGAAHDRFTLVVARHALADPLAVAASPPGGRTAIRPASDLELPLRDGRTGLATARSLAAAEVVVEDFIAR
ncbi:MAG TPA: hypothetical protein VFF06_33915 [Polyangia bacterium]|nr:hypothetical protein [Polyangia bacterium]